MTHKMHDCPNEGGKAQVQALKAIHGWPYDKTVLNVAFNKRTGTTKHETCPYCGLEAAKMEDVPIADAMLLEVNPRGSGYLRQPQSTTKAQNAELMKSNRDLSDKVDKLTKAVAELLKKKEAEQ